MNKQLQRIYAMLMMLVHDTRAEGSIGTKISEVISLVVGAIIYVYLIPTFVTAVTGIDTSGWNFTGSTGAIALLLMLPLIFIVGIVIWFIKSILD